MDDTKQVIEMNTTKQSKIIEPTDEQMLDIKKFKNLPKGLDMVEMNEILPKNIRALVKKCHSVVISFEKQLYLIQTIQKIPKDSSIVKFVDGSIFGIARPKYVDL